MGAPPPLTLGDAYWRLHHFVVDAWRRSGRPSREWMAARTGFRVEVFPDLELGRHLTWRGAKAVLVACDVPPPQIAAWQEYLRTVAGARRQASSAVGGSRIALGHTCGTTAPRGRPTVRGEGLSTMSRPGDATPATTPLDQAREARTGHEYNLALESLRRHRRRSFQQISVAVGIELLPKSTAHYMCRKETLPARREQVRLFVLGCGEQPAAAELWAAEWERLAETIRLVKAAACAEEEKTLVLRPVGVDGSAPVDGPPAVDPAEVVGRAGPTAPVRLPMMVRVLVLAVVLQLVLLGAVLYFSA